MLATARTLLSSAARTVGGSGAPVDLGADGDDTLRLRLLVTVISGTAPTLTVTIETSGDQTTWRAVGAFAPQIAPGITPDVFAPVDRYVRATWTVDGAGFTATFAIAGDSVRPYANLDDLTSLGINAFALANISRALQQKSLEAACSDANSELGRRYVLPLTAWGSDLREKVAAIATWKLLSAIRGFDPESNADKAIRMNERDARAWLVRVGENDLEPESIVDSTPDDDEGGAYVLTDPRRGW